MRIVSSCELLTIWNSSNWSLKTRPVCSYCGNNKMKQFLSSKITRTYSQCLDAQRIRLCAWIHRCYQVPNFDLSIVSTTDDSLRIKANASHKFLVTFQHAQASAALDIPQTNWIVWTSTDDQAVTILQARNAALMSVQRSDEFTWRRAPDFYCPVTGCGHDVFLIEVDDIDSSTMTNENTTECDFLGRCHIPNGDWSILENLFVNGSYLYPGFSNLPWSMSPSFHCWNEDEEQPHSDG